MIGWKHQIRQATLPMLTLAPDTRLLRASLDQHVAPVVIGARLHLAHIVENDVRTARVGDSRSTTAARRNAR